MVEKVVNGDAMKDFRRKSNGIYVTKGEVVDAKLERLVMAQAAKVKDDPYFPTGKEMDVLRAAYNARLPIMLKGPTGVAKSTLVANFGKDMHLALKKVVGEQGLQASNVIGGVIPIEVQGMGLTMQFRDGPVTMAARSRNGAIIYFTEVNKIESGVLSAFHSITDFDRMLHVPATDEDLALSPKTLVIADYNPLYKGGLDNMSPAFLQRFVHVTLEMPSQPLEQMIFEMKYNLRERPEAGKVGELKPRKVDKELVEELTKLAQDIRKGKDHQFDILEAPSPRTVDNAIKLIQQGLSPYDAVVHGLIQPLVDTLNGTYHAMLNLVDNFKTLVEGKPKSP